MRLRRQRSTGKQIAAKTGVSPATVSRVLRRLGLNKLSALEPAEPVRRYEREKPGTGFDQAMLKSLYGTMRPLRTDKNPFDQKVKDENATTWLIPKLVGEVKFSEWTSESGPAPFCRCVIREQT